MPVVSEMAATYRPVRLWCEAWVWSKKNQKWLKI